MTERRGGKPRQARVYAAATGKRLYALEAPPQGFRAVAFSADGRLLVSGCYPGDHTLLVWNLGLVQKGTD